MAAEKKGTTIVIKKIYNVQGGHGGAWKVALADFMTAMMAFFLVMWLLSQSAETKKAVSDYFSTPSLIEYNFQNFGVEITLEKLFLDLVNEPLKAFQSFLEPIDKTPNILDMGSEKLIMAHMADQLGDTAKMLQVSPDGFEFLILDTDLFEKGTAEPNKSFVDSLHKLKKIATGVSDATIEVESRLFNQSVTGSDPEVARRVATQRLDLITRGIESSLEHKTVKMESRYNLENKKDFVEGQTHRPNGHIFIRFRQNPIKSDGTKYRPLDRVFGKSTGGDVYSSFAHQLANQKSRTSKKKSEE